MTREIQSQNHRSLQTLINQILQTESLTRAEHLQLTSAILSGFRASAVERHQINRILDALSLGRIRFSD